MVLRIGNSPVDDEHLPWVTNALSKYGNKIMLPTDHIVSPAQDSQSVSLAKGDIPEGMIGFDIGVETSQQYSKLNCCKKIWDNVLEWSNGTL